MSLQFLLLHLIHIFVVEKCNYQVKMNQLFSSNIYIYIYIYALRTSVFILLSLDIFGDHINHATDFPCCLCYVAHHRFKRVGYFFGHRNVRGG